MGSEVHDAIKNFETQDEKGKLASDSLDAMMELAEHQKEVFYLKVTYAQLLARFEAHADFDSR